MSVKFDEYMKNLRNKATKGAASNTAAPSLKEDTERAYDQFVGGLRQRVAPVAGINPTQAQQEAKSIYGQAQALQNSLLSVDDQKLLRAYEEANALGRRSNALYSQWGQDPAGRNYQLDLLRGRGTLGQTANILGYERPLTGDYTGKRLTAGEVRENAVEHALNSLRDFETYKNLMNSQISAGDKNTQKRIVGYGQATVQPGTREVAQRAAESATSINALQNMLQSARTDSEREVFSQEIAKRQEQQKKNSGADDEKTYRANLYNALSPENRQYVDETDASGYPLSTEEVRLMLEGERNLLYGNMGSTADEKKTYRERMAEMDRLLGNSLETYGPEVQTGEMKAFSTWQEQGNDLPFTERYTQEAAQAARDWQDVYNGTYQGDDSEKRAALDAYAKAEDEFNNAQGAWIRGVDPVDGHVLTADEKAAALQKAKEKEAELEALDKEVQEKAAAESEKVNAVKEATHGETSWTRYLDAAANEALKSWQNALGSISSMAVKGGEMLYGIGKNLVTKGGEGLGKEISDIYTSGYGAKLGEHYKKELDDAVEESYHARKAISDSPVMDVAHSIFVNGLEMIPDIAVTLATNGASKAADAGVLLQNAMMDYMGSLGQGQVQRLMATMASNPSFYTSFVREWGSDMQALKDQGVQPGLAEALGTFTALINGMIEVGPAGDSGVQMLGKEMDEGLAARGYRALTGKEPGRLMQGLDRLAQMGMGEGTEEITQGMESAAFQGVGKALTTGEAAKPISFTAGEEALINVPDLAREGVIGGLSGAIMGGAGDVLARAPQNAQTRAQTKAMGRQIINNEWSQAIAGIAEDVAGIRNDTTAAIKNGTADLNKKSWAKKVGQLFQQTMGKLDENSYERVFGSLKNSIQNELQSSGYRANAEADARVMAKAYAAGMDALNTQEKAKFQNDGFRQMYEAITGNDVFKSEYDTRTVEQARKATEAARAAAIMSQRSKAQLTPVGLEEAAAKGTELANQAKISEDGKLHIQQIAEKDNSGANMQLLGVDVQDGKVQVKVKANGESRMVAFEDVQFPDSQTAERVALAASLGGSDLASALLNAKLPDGKDFKAYAKDVVSAAKAASLGVGQKQIKALGLADSLDGVELSTAAWAGRKMEWTNAAAEAVTEQLRQRQKDYIKQQVAERLGDRQLDAKAAPEVHEAIFKLANDQQIKPTQKQLLAEYGIDQDFINQIKETVQPIDEPDVKKTVDAAVGQVEAMQPEEQQDGDLYGVETARNYGLAGMSQADLIENLQQGGDLTSAQRMAYTRGVNERMRQQQERVRQIQEINQGGKKRQRPGVVRSLQQVDMDYLQAQNIQVNPVRSRMSDRQRSAINALRFFAQDTGLNFVLYESPVNEKGVRTGSNGFYDKSSRTIYLDMFAGQDNNEAVVRALGHEMTHVIQEYAPSEYAGLRDFLLDAYARHGKQTVTQLVAAQIQKGKQINRNYTEAQAMDELVADASEMVFQHPEDMRRLAQEKPTVFQRIKDWLDRVVNALKRAMEGVDPESREARLLVSMDETWTEYRRRWYDAYNTMAENLQYEQPDAQTAENLPAAAQNRTVQPARITRTAVVQPETESRETANLAPQTASGTGTAYTNDQTPVQFHYEAVPVGNLITSNNQRFEMNPDYPQELQPRDRTRTASREQVYSIARSLNPARLGESADVQNGAPIVGRDLVVESGNGRTMALRHAMLNMPEQARRYTDWLRQNAARFGLDPSSIQEDSVLVRVRDSAMDRTAFVKAANESTTAAYSESEAAESDAEKLTPAMMEIFEPGENGEINTAENASFANQYMERVIPAAERGNYMQADGTISQRGWERIENGIFQKAYGSAALTQMLSESTDEGSRNILKALLRAAPRAVQTAEQVRMGNAWDIGLGEMLTNAARRYMQLKRDGIKLDTYLNQVAMPGLETEDAGTQAMMRAFEDLNRAPRRLANVLQNTMQLLEEYGDPRQVSLLGESTAPDAAALVTQAVAREQQENTETIRHSARNAALDAEYMQAVEDGDTEEQQRMVDEAAREAGYNSPVLYHGTRAFGFTEFDLNLSENSIFATSERELAQTYSGETQREKINERVNYNVDELTPDRLIEEVKKYVPKKYDRFRMLSDANKKELLQSYQKEISEKTNIISDFLSANSGLFNDEMDYIVRSMKICLEEMAETQNEEAFEQAYTAYHRYKRDFAEMDEPFADELNNWLGDMESISYAYAMTYPGGLYTDGLDYLYDNMLRPVLENKINRGIYRLYGRLGNTLEIDGEEESWKKINPPKVLGLKGPQNTRSIAKAAFALGYDSVVIKNIFDNGGYEDYDDTGDIYIFNARNAVKSADPVTYDDAGNVIPLSERFNQQQPDIRYSLRAFDDGTRFVDVEEEQELFNGLTDTQKRNKAKQIIKAKYQGKVIGIDNQAFVSGVSAGEYSRPSVYIRDSNIVDAKMRASSELDNILDAGTFIEHKDDGEDGHKHKYNVGGFDYYKTLFKVGNEYFEGVINVENVTKGRLFKDITQIKNVTEDITSSYGVNPKSRFLRNVSMNSISDSGENVNGNSIQNSARDTSYQTNRQILAGALVSIAANANERQMLEEYQNIAGQLDMNERRISQINEEVRNIRLSEQNSDRERALLAERKQLEAEITAADKRLYNMERLAPLKRIANQQRAKAENDLQRVREHMQRYRQGIAQRERIASIERTSRRLAKWLTAPAGKSGNYVPEALRAPLGEFLLTIDKMSAQRRAGGPMTQEDKRFAYQLGQISRMLQNIDDGQTGTIEQQISGMYLDMPKQFTQNLAELVGRVEQRMQQAGAREGGNMLDRMTSEELETLDQSLIAISSSITHINDFMTDSFTKGVRETAAETIKELDAMKPKQKQGKTRKFLEDFITWDNSMPIFAFERLGKNGQAIFNSLREGQSKLAFNAKQVIDESEKAYTAKEAKAWSQEIKEFDFGEGNIIRIPVANLMSLYCLNQREQGIGHLYGEGIRVADFEEGKGARKVTVHDRGHVVSEAQVQKMLEALTPRQIEVAKNLQHIMSTLGAEWGNHVSMRRFGFRQFTEKNYFPIKSDSDLLPARTDNGTGNELYKLLNMSAAKPLVQKANNRLMLESIFDVYAGHMADMAQYNALALPILDAVKWFNFKESSQEEGETAKYTSGVRDSIRNAYGQSAIKYVTEFLKDINGGGMTGDTSTKFYQKMLGKYNRVAVAANVRVALLQPLAIIRAGMELPGTSLAKGTIKAIPNLKAEVREMQEHSGIALWKNLGYREMNIGRSVKQQIQHMETWQDKVSDKSMALAGIMDNVTWGAMWKASKEYISHTQPQLIRGSEEYFQAVTKKFEDVVYKTQVVDSMLTKSQLMRSQDFGHKLMGSFMSEPTTTFNQLMAVWDKFRISMKKGDSFSQAWQKNGRMLGRTMYYYLLAAAVNTAIEQLMTAYRDDDDYENFQEKYMDGFWETMIDNANPLTLLPGMKQVWEAGGKRLLGMDTFDDQNVLTEGINTVVDGIEKIAGGKGTVWGRAYTLAKGLSMTSGLPLSPLMREAQALWNNTVVHIQPDWRLETSPTSKTIGYDILYKALAEQDEERFEWVKQRLFANGADDEKISTNLANRIRDDLKAGQISAAEAESRLVDYTGKGENDAYYKVQEWGYEAETGDDYSRFGNLKSAILAGGSTKEAEKELLDHGYTQKQIDTKKKSLITQAAKDGEINDAEATRLYGKYAGMDKDDAYWQLQSAHYEKEDEDDSFQKYGKLEEAVLTGRSVDAAKKELTGHGVAEKDVNSKVRSIVSEQVVNNKMTDAKAISLLKQYGGMDDNEAWIRTQELAYQKKTGQSTSSDTAMVIYAIDTNTSPKTAIDGLLAHGKEKSGIASSLTSHYKEDYLKLLQTDKTKAATLKGRLVSTFEYLGYDGLKKVNDWENPKQKKTK